MSAKHSFIYLRSLHQFVTTFPYMCIVEEIKSFQFSKQAVKAEVLKPDIVPLFNRAKNA